MDTISRSAANSPGLFARDLERVRPVPHSAKDRLERRGEDHAQPHKDGRSKQHRPAPDDAPDQPATIATQGAPLAPPPPVRPAPTPERSNDRLEDGVEAIRRLMVEKPPEIDLQR
jgi:hypothetical protein